MSTGNLFVDFYLYAIVPSGATAASNLAYVINDFPTQGSLYWDDNLIDINYQGDDIHGNRSDPNPVVRYIPNSGFIGSDSFTYYSYYRDGTSDLITVPLALGCRWVDQCNTCEGNNSCLGCLDSQKDACGVCFGTGLTCAGCDGVPQSNMKIDSCGVCGGLDKEKDACGVCFGDNSTCVGCDGHVNSNTTVDSCGVCGGLNKEKDVCGVCLATVRPA